jgi:hypothetical protein
MSCDEITIVDNGFWICTHAYVVQLWVKVPILFQIECIMDGSGNNNLIEVIVAALMKYGGLTRENISKNCYALMQMGLLFFKGGGGQVLQGKSNMFGHPFQWVFIV